MENRELNKLIYNNKLVELSNITNVSDLTRYEYLGKYLLEFLLEKNIHTRRMDSYAITDNLWIKLYLKYHITKPLVKSSLEKLLTLNNNELLLKTLLVNFNNNERILLYHNIKQNDYWLYRLNESLIIKLYSELGINLPRIFIELPKISDKNIHVNKTNNDLLQELNDTYSDIDKNILDTFINELKHNLKINQKMTKNDIYKLILLKRKYPNFKLMLMEYENDQEEAKAVYNSEERKIVIDSYENGTFTHELSHMLYDKFESKTAKRNNLHYQKIQNKIDNETINKIISYLKDFHQRYKYMNDVFGEIYLANINSKFGNLANYYNIIMYDLNESKPDFIKLDNIDTTIFLTDDNTGDVIKELLHNEGKLYVSTLLDNYYMEELFLENFLDALLKGKIFDNKYGIESLSGHSMKYFSDDDDLSFNECLADYYAIKFSSKSNIIINKLRTIVGDELVDFFERYLSRKRKTSKNFTR